jgi:hypothetical protein
MPLHAIFFMYQTYPDCSPDCTRTEVRKRWYTSTYDVYQYTISTQMLQICYKKLQKITAYGIYTKFRVEF